MCLYIVDMPFKSSLLCIYLLYFSMNCRIRLFFYILRVYIIFCKGTLFFLCKCFVSEILSKFAA